MSAPQNSPSPSRGRGRGRGRGHFSSSPHRGRGFYRGRAHSPFRGRGGGYTPPGRDILNGLVPRSLKTIDPAEAASMPDITIEDVQYLASYNWDNKEDPTIIVPGAPKMWLGRTLPFTVKPDGGHSFVDQNSHRMPLYPLLPLFRAVDFMEQDRDIKFDWTSVDIVTDRSSMRKLLSFAQGTTEDFRIDVQLVGAWTVLFHRWEARHLDGDEMRGYADSFERATTAPAPGMDEWTGVGHNRVVSYELGDLKLVLRYGVEAYYPDQVRLAQIDTSEQIERGARVAAVDPSELLDELAATMAALDITKPTLQPATADPERTRDVRIVRGGVEVPQSSLIKLKTRSSKSVAWFDWGWFYPQQFLGQIPTQILAVHHQGTFYEIRENALEEPEFQAVASEAQKGLKRLLHILQEIHNFVGAHGKKSRLSLVCKNGLLEVMERQSEDSYLPPDVLRRFDSS